MQNKIDKITDILRRDDGISGAMHYTEQIGWILFLKFLDDYETNLKDLAFLDGKDYKSILQEKFSWSVWAAPKKDGKLDVKNALSGSDLLEFLKNDALFGKEKTPLSYAMGVMNMILHEISSPNIIKTNTLSKKITDITEQEKYEVILANPPFGGKEKEQIQENFPIKSNATELLFLQHILRSLKNNGRCAIIVPEGVLFQNSNAFVSVKKDLLDDFNLECVLSLPSGVFLPYSAVKTNVLFFSKGLNSILKANDDKVYYYELIPPYKLTKNKPLEYAHFNEFLKYYKERKITANSWLVSKKELEERNYDLSAKNPNVKEEKILRTSEEILNSLEENLKTQQEYLNELKSILK
ncbi:TPA: N-6 DNA methylase [Campylobacter jejuni]